ncbi:Pr6Pr family membrane protein [Agrococcus sp. SL85]|uniref:Pr6Pr family membrane protein n=1 Tax=Agrococcus sp. SL85 TaxID=2995141 RepID=UPI00226C7A0C|nr:Pr6Pr family membrane protein [Agrococcus sp. SL85]WAC67172.1 Pr6Pr family membrane protein [Agrococcus sp. SL85]
MSTTPVVEPSANASRLRRALLVGRAAIALLILAAVIGQLVVSLGFWTERGDPDIGQNVGNFFSFFTIQSNLLAMVTLGVLVAAQLGRPRIGRRFDVLLLCATTYMVVTGIVYNILLRGIELPQGSTLGWSNEVLHLVAPLWMLLDWLLSPRRRELRWRDLGVVAIYPLVWLAYTLLRAPLIDDTFASGKPYWYPYPFLDPANHDGGFAGVAVMCVVVAAIVVAGGALLLWFARWRGARTAAAVDARP